MYYIKEKNKKEKYIFFSKCEGEKETIPLVSHEI
jgi:hypothetical protein